MAQLLTPWPINACSLASPSQRAEAPLAIIKRARVQHVFSNVQLKRPFGKIDAGQVPQAEICAEA